MAAERAASDGAIMAHNHRTHAYDDAVHVLIEAKNAAGFLPPRRSSLAPPSTSAKRQRTATTLHPSIPVPDALIASLSSTALVSVQANILPLPSGRPLVLLVQIDDHIPTELSTTPSALCFPSMTSPTPEGVYQALGPLRHATKELDAVRARNELAIIAYSTDVHLPGEISTAALERGAHALLTPPFTPTTVEVAIQSALQKRAKQPSVYSLPTLPATPDSALRILPPSPLPTNSTPLVTPISTIPSKVNIIPSLLGSPADQRRGSVDIGLLSECLTRDESGWAGMAPNSGDPDYAELLAEMHAQTSAAVDATVMPPSLSVFPNTRTRLVNSLSSWQFEPYRLAPDELLLCTIIIFESLLALPNLPSSLSSLSVKTQLTPFLSQLRTLYRSSNRYHSFVHAVDVLQGIYYILRRAGVVPPLWREKGQVWHRTDREQEGSLTYLLKDGDVFLLCLAAIGHDVGHPGNSNAFLKNVQAPLSRLFEHKSALERMHCTILLRLLARHGMRHLVDPCTPEGREGRRVIMGTVLATDMGWHFEWVERFERSVRERKSGVSSVVGGGIFTNGWSLGGETLEVEELAPEEAEREDRLFICQALMKCGDISNPSRPYLVSKHWSTVLLEEWAAQALLERHLGLPVSVVADANEKVQADGQINFINIFVLPLLERVSEAVPAIKEFVHHCEENKVLWQERLAQLQGTDGSGPSASPSSVLRPVPLTKPILPPMARYAKSIFPLSLPPLEACMPPLASKLASMSPWAAQPRPNSPSPTRSKVLPSPISPSSGNLFSASSSGTSVSSSSSSCTVWENPHVPTVQEVKDSVKVGWKKRLKRRRSFRRASVDHSGRMLGPVGPLPTVITTGV